MQIEWQIASLPEWRADAGIFFVFERPLENPVPGFERWRLESGSWIASSTALTDFQGKSEQAALFHGPSDSPIPRLVLVGLGPRDKFDMDRWRKAAAIGVRKCREWQIKRPALPLLAFDGIPFESLEVAFQEALIGAMLGLYSYDALKTKDTDKVAAPETLLILGEKEPEEALRAAVPAAAAIVSGVRLARDLTTAPGNEVTPSHLVATARRLAEAYGFPLKVIDCEEAATLGMGAFLAVARGSREPAYVIVIENAPPGTEQDRPLVLVGKGITFDTGGISIKPSEKMASMKEDMAGAAAVLGAFEALGRLEIRKRVVGIIPCTENMPDGQAYKPGDVLRTMSGQTVEVISTDAEGRLILADALTYAARFEPAAIVDIATLTGACLVALGSQVAGIMGNRDAFTREIQEIGMQVGEKLWQLPLWDLYAEALKSSIADFKNVGDRQAGTIVAAMFLRQFVSDETPWVHLDIAGPAWIDKDLYVSPAGATGFGVRIFMELIRRWPLEI